MGSGNTIGDDEKGKGLTSHEAFDKLKLVIQHEILAYSEPWSIMQMCQDMYEALHSNQSMPINWFGVALLLICGSALLTGHSLSNNLLGHNTLFEGYILILSALVIFICVVREQILHRTEIVHKVKKILEVLKDSRHWSAQSYPSLNEPSSNAIKMVWTFRDGVLVNLPWNLLVEGDVILLGPSHIAPAYVQQISTSQVPVRLEAEEVYNPPCRSTKDGIEDGSEPGQCQPHPRERFIVMETPIRRFLRGAFQKGCKRPQSVLNADMKRVCHVMRTKVFWGVIIVGFFANYIRWRIFPESVGHYADVLIVAPIYAVLPLIPASFPILWILTTYYGTARVRTLFSMALEDLVSTEAEEDFPSKLEHIPCWKVLAEFKEICIGNPECLSRTANLLHSLGSASTLCCADKEGILCFPNPIPEKVFILRHCASANKSKPLEENDEGITFQASTDASMGSRNEDSKGSSYGEEKELSVEEHHPEVLNLSFDAKDPLGICFDDANWKLYLDSLKPLGINVLMNSPCSSPFKNAQIEDFTGHISLGANSSPLPNMRRCLCLLAQTVGFDEAVMSSFTTLAQVITFRPVHAVGLPNVRSNFFLSIIREKQVPSMVSIVSSDKSTGVIQLFTQGSAEVVLDACTDFWDGEELCEISAEDRKQALDFYNRMNITGHCIAFSYRPIFEFSEDLIDTSVFLQYPSNTPISPSEDTEDTASEWSFGQHVEETMKTIPQEKVNGIVDCKAVDLTCPTEEKKDLKPVARLLKNQIFVGMVTLQDLVKEDIASLVEELNSGGIRFVHFSYENELRSRVFAERLGLETGWNCHISLAESSERTAVDKESAVSHDSELEPLLNSASNATLEFRTESKTLSGDVGDEDEEETEEDGENDSTNFSDFFFMSNRAKLPRGIKNIRPHLEKVDDVPLLVPLFTDCNPHTIREMISIMQDYGETVCCIGSSLNVNNVDIFSQADVSIAIDPLHPQQCLLGKVDNFRCGSPPVRKKVDRASLSGDIPDPRASPLNISAELTGIPCSLTCHRNDKIKVVHLICEARRVLNGMRNAFTFLFCCCLALSAMQLASFCIPLPLPFSGCQLLWLLLVLLPMLSVSIIGAPAEKGVMQRMPGKKLTDMKETTRQFLIQFCPTFLVVGIITVGILNPLTLHTICQTSIVDGSHCWFFTGPGNTTEPWGGYGGALKGGIIIAQEFNLVFVLLCFIFISVSYVHRTKQIWAKSPLTNRPWCITVLILVLLQLVYTTAALQIRGLTLKPGDPYSLRNVHFSVFLCGIVMPPVFTALSEASKRKFIRTYKRFQRRERLKFDTKLGMNSPV